MNEYIQGFLMGIAYVAPIGVQNLFVINTALTQKRSRALLTALIVIFFDITLALGCFFGIGYLIENIHWLRWMILLIGSIIVIKIGISLILTKDVNRENTNTNLPILKIITSACVVTWFNPQAIIDGTLIFGAFKASLGKEKALNFIFGATSASFVWFTGLTIIILLFSHKFNNKVLKIINISCGIIIIFYGLKLFYSFYSIFLSKM